MYEATAKLFNIYPLCYICKVYYIFVLEVTHFSTGIIFSILSAIWINGLVRVVQDLYRVVGEGEYILQRLTVPVTDTTILQPQSGYTWNWRSLCRLSCT